MRIAAYAGLLAVAIGAYFFWEGRVSDRAIEQFRVEQVQKVIEAKDREISSLKDQVQILIEVQNASAKTSAELERELEEVKGTISRAKEDRGSSAVLKDTIDEIRRRRK